MRHNRFNKTLSGMVGTAAPMLLFLIAPGCGQSKTADRAAEQEKFLAPTDVSKLRPEAREALRSMPGGDKAQSVNRTAAPK